MEIHKPKPWHGWREFLKEYAIIVLGVLTALGAEQIAEQIHWAGEVRHAHSSLRSEIVWNNRVFTYRAAAEPCVARRLDALQGVIDRAAAHRPTPFVAGVRPDIANAIDDSNWEAHRASQTLTHFDEAELDRLGQYYLQISNSRYFIRQEDDAWSDLSAVEGDPARLASEDFAGLRRALQRARFYNRIISLISREQLDRTRELRIPVQAPEQARLKAVCAPWPEVR